MKRSLSFYIFAVSCFIVNVCSAYLIQDVVYLILFAMPIYYRVFLYNNCYKQRKFSYAHRILEIRSPLRFSHECCRPTYFVVIHISPKISFLWTTPGNAERQESFEIVFPVSHSFKFVVAPNVLFVLKAKHHMARLSFWLPIRYSWVSCSNH